MENSRAKKGWQISRREFLQAAGIGVAGVSLSGRRLLAMGGTQPSPYRKQVGAVVRGAFLYPPTESLRKRGYYSWPGSTFDAEGHQKQYAAKIRKMETDLGMRIVMDNRPLDDEASVTRFISNVKSSEPDGLLLIPFKKGHWTHVTRIIEETGIPTVVLATLGVLLVDHINQLHRKSGVYMISSLDNLDAVEYGMRMVRTARWMREARIVNIVASEVKEESVPVLGTRVRTIPHERFYEEFRRTEATSAVRKLADAYRKNARKVVEPSRKDILEAAKCYFALKRIIEAEQADAIMMRCLAGLKRPHKHVPPCMGFMSLRDEGIPAGCQADLDATLTLMLVQQLFDKPGFQQNASMETEKNLYFGAHCTSASKMKGINAPSEPYILRNHAEAGWGCVPRVLFAKGQEVTMAEYAAGEKPHMLIYSGKVVDCPPIPPTGGCRTNIEMTINEVDDVCDVKGMHQIIFYGNYAKHLRAFCQLYGIEVVT
ncbi:MAG: twin-arginine translocation signal domain-containing protein [Planctomycetota bacterium]